MTRRNKVYPKVTAVPLSSCPPLLTLSIAGGREREVRGCKNPTDANIPSIP
jgi:hypothetical protein